MLKKTVPIIIVILVISLLIGCGGTVSESENSALLPQKADTVGLLELGRILTDRDIIDLYDKLPKEAGDPETFDEAMDQATEESGIDPRSFKDILFFADTSAGTGDSSYFGAIVTGTFDKDGIISAIEGAGEISLNTTEYKGYDIYGDIEQTSALAFLNDNTLVVGSLEAVMDVIDVEVGDEPALSGEVADTYASFGNILIKMASNISSDMVEDAVNQITELLPVPIDLSSLVNIDTAELTVDKENQSLNLDLVLCFTDNASAKGVKGLVTLAKAMINMFEVPEQGPGGFPIPEGSQTVLSGLLSKLEVEVIDECLTISLNMTFDEIEDLLSEQG
ncbi:MAG: hypothetical protein MUP21_14135 [Dehalococcoidia bacterium]|nr:hypothetical protein [Dehalococcoidia bacterium]